MGIFTVFLIFEWEFWNLMRLAFSLSSLVSRLLCDFKEHGRECKSLIDKNKNFYAIFIINNINNKKREKKKNKNRNKNCLNFAL